MDAKKAGGSLDSLVSAFNARIAELQELVIARNSMENFETFCCFALSFRHCFFVHNLVPFCLSLVYPASSVTDLSAIDAALKAVELQVQGIKDLVREETLAIPKAKVHFSVSLSLSLCLNSGFCFVFPLNFGVLRFLGIYVCLKKLSYWLD